MENSTPEVVTNQPAPATPEVVTNNHSTITANFNPNIDIVDTKFPFRKVVDKESGVESTRATVQLKMPVPSIEGIVAILTEGGKGLELLKEAVTNIVKDRARELLTEDVNEELTEENFPLKELSWSAIANQPAAERRGGGISKELWDDFGKDYETVMVATTGKPLAQIKNAVKIYMNKFSLVKTDKKVLAALKGQLALYLNSTPNSEKFVDCVDALDKKADMLIDADSSNTMASLGL